MIFFDSMRSRDTFIYYDVEGLENPTGSPLCFFGVFIWGEMPIPVTWASGDRVRGEKF